MLRTATLPPRVSTSLVMLAMSVTPFAIGPVSSLRVLRRPRMRELIGARSKNSGRPAAPPTRRPPEGCHLGLLPRSARWQAREPGFDHRKSVDRARDEEHARSGWPANVLVRDVERFLDVDRGAELREANEPGRFGPG